MACNYASKKYNKNPATYFGSCYVNAGAPDNARRRPVTSLVEEAAQMAFN